MPTGIPGGPSMRSPLGKGRGPYRSGMPSHARPFAPGAMNRMFCGRGCCSESLPSAGGDGARFSFVSSMTGCHFGVVSMLHLAHRRSDRISATLDRSFAPSSASVLVSAREDVLAPRRTAAAILCAPDSRLFPPCADAGSNPLSLVSCACAAFRTVPVKVRSACL